jgi:hypothetical protein
MKKANPKMISKAKAMMEIATAKPTYQKDAMMAIGKKALKKGKKC